MEMHESESQCCVEVTDLLGTLEQSHTSLASQRLAASYDKHQALMVHAQAVTQDSTAMLECANSKPKITWLHCTEKLFDTIDEALESIPELSIFLKLLKVTQH